MRRKPTRTEPIQTNPIDLYQLREYAEMYPEVKRICINRAIPIFVLQIELERYRVRLDKNKFNDFQKTRLSFN